ncbi:MAG: VWA domain-containing protein [Akkermansiaceae bacterium]|nr:VWA domain-containing protein [Akkermansiaceae bacterium]
MNFLYPYVLIALAAPILLSILAYVLHVHRKSNWKLLVSARHSKELVKRTPALRSVLPRVLAVGAIICCILAAARPYHGFRNTEAQLTGRNLLIAMDISRSMETTDVGGARLEEARNAARTLIDALPKDKIGLILFSGESELSTPLTYDHKTLQSKINLVDREWERYGGTNFDELLRTSLQTFQRAGASGSNALVILSDGEDTIDISPELIEEAQKNKLLIITVGIGTEEGDTIPDKRDRNGLWRNEDDQPVISKLQARTLKMLATETGGDFFILTDKTDLSAFAQAAAEKIDKHEEALELSKTPNDVYMYFAVAALVFALSAILLETGWRRLPQFGKAAMVICALPVGLGGHTYATPQEESVAAYKKALELKNAGDTEQAAAELAKALLDDDALVQAAALHQLGNIATEKTLSELRALYTATDNETPPEPSIEQLENIETQLEKDTTYYRDALTAKTDFTDAQLNLDNINTLRNAIKKEIERLKKKKEEEAQQQQQQQQQQQNKNDQQQQQDQQNKDDQQQQQDQQNKDDQQQQQDQQNKDDQQQDQQNKDDQQQQDQQNKDDQQQQQEQQNKDDQQQQEQQNKDDQQQQQEQQNKDDQQQQQQEEDSQKPQDSEDPSATPESAQAARAKQEQRKKQRAQDMLNMYIDEESESESRTLRREYDYRTRRKRPKLDY